MSEQLATKTATQQHTDTREMFFIFSDAKLAGLTSRVKPLLRDFVDVNNVNEIILNKQHYYCYEWRHKNNILGCDIVLIK